jgi:hypothetical protein
MNHKRQEVLNSLNDCFQEAEQRINELQNQLAKVKIERDTYKTMLEQGNTKNNTLAYMTIHSCDNGEGVDTETCIGVFTTKPLALRAMLDVCNKNEEISLDAFRIEEFDVGKTLIHNDIVHVEQHDEEAHCEIATSIIGILCDANKHIYVYLCNSYLVEYIVDKVYYIEY